MTPLAPHSEGVLDDVEAPPRNPRPAPSDEGAFANAEVPRPPSFTEADDSDKPAAVREAANLEPGSEPDAELEGSYRGRMESLLAVDRMVGEIVGALRRTGELEDTYVIFTSDNGYLLGEHNQVGKHLLYEESIRVPLVVRGPGIPAGEVRPEPVQNIDLAPTIVDVAAVQEQRLMDGVPLLGSEPLDPRRDLFVTYPESALAFDAVRTHDGFIYAEYEDGAKELYDLKRDPGQLENVADEPAYADVQERLAERLGDLRDCAGDGCALAAGWGWSRWSRWSRWRSPARPRRRAATCAVATSGNRSERHETIPITRTPRAAREVAMSLSPQRLPSLATGDRLRITAELQTTNNCYERTNLCVSRPYRYSPRIGTKLVIARRHRATRGPDVKGITPRRESNCDQRQGNRQHHCVAVYLGSKLTIPTPDKLPCQLDQCRINLVVDSHHPQARRGDELILGIDRPGGKVERRPFAAERDAAARVGYRGPQAADAEAAPPPGAGRGGPEVLGALDAPAQPDRGPAAHVRGVADGRDPPAPLLELHGLAADPRAAPGAVTTSAFTRGVGSLQGEVTEGNGFNCTQRTTPCTARRVGTLVIEQTPVRDGRTVPLYVNFVLRNAPKEVRDRVHDYMRLRGGGITARRYR